MHSVCGMRGRSYLGGLASVRRHGGVQQELRPQVGRHHNDDVGEVDGATLTVRHTAVVQQRQQHIEHLGMR